MKIGVRVRQVSPRGRRAADPAPEPVPGTESEKGLGDLVAGRRGVGRRVQERLDPGPAVRRVVQQPGADDGEQSPIPRTRRTGTPAANSSTAPIATMTAVVPRSGWMPTRIASTPSTMSTGRTTSACAPRPRRRASRSAMNTTAASFANPTAAGAAARGRSSGRIRPARCRSLARAPRPARGPCRQGTGPRPAATAAAADASPRRTRRHRGSSTSPGGEDRPGRAVVRDRLDRRRQHHHETEDAEPDDEGGERRRVPPRRQNRRPWARAAGAGLVRAVSTSPRARRPHPRRGATGRPRGARAPPAGERRAAR